MVDAQPIARWMPVQRTWNGQLKRWWWVVYVTHFSSGQPLRISGDRISRFPTTTVSWVCGGRTRSLSCRLYIQLRRYGSENLSR